jgi:hypothetical protein
MYLWHPESRCGYNTMEHHLTTAGRLLHTEIESFEEGGLDEEAL